MDDPYSFDKIMKQKFFPLIIKPPVSSVVVSLLMVYCGWVPIAAFAMAQLGKNSTNCLRLVVQKCYNFAESREH